MIFFNQTFSSTLAYTSRPYQETLATQPAFSYTPCATTYNEKTGDIVTSAQFEEVNLVGNKFNVAEDESISD